MRFRLPSEASLLQFRKLYFKIWGLQKPLVAPEVGYSFHGPNTPQKHQNSILKSSFENLTYSWSPEVTSSFRSDFRRPSWPHEFSRNSLLQDLLRDGILLINTLSLIIQLMLELFQSPKRCSTPIQLPEKPFAIERICPISTHSDVPSSSGSKNSCMNSTGFQTSVPGKLTRSNSS